MLYWARCDPGRYDVPSGGHMASEDRIREGRLARLTLWNRLFHGVPVGSDELSPLLCGDPDSPDERAAYTMLCACARVANSSRQAIRCALRIAILYWFSNIGERDGRRSDPLEPKRNAFHLGEAIGTGLTWDEAVAAMKRKPIDFSAYLRLLEILEEECEVELRARFPGLSRASIDILGGRIQESDFARRWADGSRIAAETRLGYRSGRG